jgi:hypothetical protein
MTFPDVADAVWKNNLQNILRDNAFPYIPYHSQIEEFRWFNNLGFQKLEKAGILSVCF